MKILITRSLFFIGFLSYLMSLGNITGATGGNTGAPGEDTCGRSGCHATSPNTGSASIDLQLDSDATTYIPGNTHNVSISINNPQDAARNGFEIVALNAQNNNIGEWIISGEYLQTTIANNRNYVTHSEDGSILTSWDIGWKAPSSNEGPITFYVAVNDANNNIDRTGDNIYTTSLQVEAQTTSSVKTITSLENIAVFPNPIKNYINLSINLTESTNLKGILVNTVGQSIEQLFHQEIPIGDSNLSIPFPPGISTGHYFLKIEDLEGGVKSIPLFKSIGN